MGDPELNTMPPSEDSTDYGDQQSYFGKKDEGLTFKGICLRAIEKCRVEGSKEMTKGGESTIYAKELGQYVTVTLPDQRKVWQQSVMQLYDLLIYYFDKEAIKKFDDLNTKLNEAYPRFVKQYIEAEYWMPYKEVAIRSNIIKTGRESNVGIFYLQAYEEYIFGIYRLMYQELLLLFKRKNELSNKRTLGAYD